jgi:putative transposase
VYLDVLYVKMRHEGRVENRAAYVAIGVTREGRKEVLGLWTSAGEGAQFRLSILTEWRNRGVRDIFIACVDGLNRNRYGVSSWPRNHTSEAHQQCERY